MDNAAQILTYLEQLEQRSKARTDQLPDNKLVVADWQGLAFSVNGVQLICAMNEVSEMLPVPDAVTWVPGSDSWMLGLANVRGNLLPLVDLQAFLGGKPAIIGNESRVLVVRNKNVVTGLVVPGVTGMRYMVENQRISDVRFEGRIGDYVYDMFEAEATTWPVFSMAALMADQDFLIAAV